MRGGQLSPVVLLKVTAHLDIMVPVIPLIPLEIMDNILHNLRTHWVKDLGACALVSRTWREFTRPHLFSEMSFAFEVGNVIDFITCTGTGTSGTLSGSSLNCIMLMFRHSAQRRQDVKLIH